MMPVDALAIRLVEWLGIDIDRGGQRDALARLITERTARLGRASELAYVEALTGADDPELPRIVNAVSVLHTWLFRDPAQLAVIEAALLECEPGRPSRVWVPACATGEDAYSVAIVAARAGLHVRVVGSDINVGALDVARVGRYGRLTTREAPEEVLAAFMVKDGDSMRVEASLKERVSFVRHNLVEPPLAIDGGWDLIFCRNALIYFSPDKAQMVIERLGTALAEVGWLVLGASEIIHAVPSGLELIEVGKRFALRRHVQDDASAASTASASRRPSRFPSRRPSAFPRDALADVHEQLRSGRADEAIHACERALSSSPGDPRASLYLGIAHYMRREWSKALGVLTAMTAREASWPAFFYAGLCHEALGRAEQARASFEEALSCGSADSGGGISVPLECAEEAGVWWSALVNKVRGGGRALSNGGSHAEP
jgi:chemotaxis methyl-accepting protein methylase